MAAAKRKMQNVKFHSLDEFFEFIPKDELKIIEALRKIIFECIPDCTEGLSYNVPYYRRHGAICFIWPSSITWGGMQQKGVRFGFTNGNLLYDELNYLDKGERKQVYWRDFSHVKEINSQVLENLLHQAVLIDQEKVKNNSKKKSKKKLKPKSS